VKRRPTFGKERKTTACLTTDLFGRLLEVKSVQKIVVKGPGACFCSSITYGVVSWTVQRRLFREHVVLWMISFAKNDSHL
jgi:hypothetical protein